jgi:hypothetical protein
LLSFIFIYVLSGSGLLRGKFDAQASHSMVNQDANVAHGELGDAADFFITKSILKFESDYFLLISREAVDQTEEGFVGFSRFNCFRGSRFVRGDSFHLAVLKTFHAPFLTQYIQRSVPTYGEKPFGEVSVDGFRRLREEFDKRILNDIARSIEVANHPRGIARKRSLKVRDGCLHKISSFFMRNYPIHWGLS